MSALVYLAAATAFASAPSDAQDHIILVPLDSRPAAGQFAQMIGRISGADVRMPPYEDLGRFTDAGQPEAILRWLESTDMSHVDALVISTDMIAYGGLIASRTNGATVHLATTRLNRISALKRKYPQLKIYGFSATMRLAPTATSQTQAYQTQLARLVELQDRAARGADPYSAANAQKLLTQVPPAVLASYRATRNRNHLVQRELLRMVAKRNFDYLIIGQDDAKPYGPHIAETAELKRIAAGFGVTGLTYFCEGIDQHSNVLVSRAILRRHDIVPRVRVVYSDPEGANRYDAFESKPIGASLRDQIFASGARPMSDDGIYDYTLYLNVPKPDPTAFESFATQLADEIDRGENVAVADTNFAGDASADPRIIDLLSVKNRASRLMAYAGWNTAGNTMGTSIPAANMVTMARVDLPDKPFVEVARTEFLLHRLVNDYAYHKFTRPAAYRLLTATLGSSKYETRGSDQAVLNEFVKRDLSKYLGEYFRDWFFGQTFRVGAGTYRIEGLNDSKIWLPWPRAYEVRLEFHLAANQIPDTQSAATPAR